MTVLTEVINVNKRKAYQHV